MKFKKAEAGNAALNLTRKIVEACGVRFAGTESCNRAGRMLRDELEKSCDHTYSEEFEFPPWAMLSYLRVITGSYVLAVPFYFIGGIGVYVSMALLIFGFVYAHLQFNTYRSSFDFLFPKKTGKNIYGIIEPAGETKRQILITGHHDSAGVCRFFLRWQKLFPFRVIAALIVYFLVTAVTAFWTVYRLITGIDPSVLGWFGYAAAAGILIVFPLFFMYMHRLGSPGAGDNMIASTMAAELAKYFSKKCDGQTLESTRLVFLSTDAEESGLKGARAFVAAHSEELKKYPASVITLECFYKIADLRFLTNDCNGYVKLSTPLAQQCSTIASERGYPSAMVQFPFGGGATDAAEFAREGIDACTILGMSTDLIRDGLVYHTPYDTPDKIEPAVVEAVLEILYEFIIDADGQR